MTKNVCASIGSPLLLRIQNTGKLRGSPYKRQRIFAKPKRLHLLFGQDEESIIARHDTNIYAAELSHTCQLRMVLRLPQQGDLVLVQIILRPLLLRVVNRFEMMPLSQNDLVTCEVVRAFQFD